MYIAAHTLEQIDLTENVSDCRNFETRFVLHSDKYMYINSKLTPTKTNSLQYVVTYDSHQKPNKYKLECDILRMENRDFQKCVKFLKP